MHYSYEINSSCLNKEEIPDSQEQKNDNLGGKSYKVPKHHFNHRNVQNKR